MLAIGPRVLGLLGGVLLLSASQAQALTVVSVVGGAPAGTNYINFDSVPLNTTPGSYAVAPGVTLALVPNAQAVQGSTTTYAAPWLSGGNGTLFGDPNDGADATTYITSGCNGGGCPNASATLTFTGEEQYFGLLWGSVDTYNTLQFFDGATLVGTVTGSTVTASANGDRGVNGTYYVNITSPVQFNTVVFTSSQYAFEFDNVAFNPTIPPNIPGTPLPGALALFAGGLGLLGFTGLRRNRKTGRSLPSLATA